MFFDEIWVDLRNMMFAELNDHRMTKKEKTIKFIGTDILKQ